MGHAMATTIAVTPTSVIASDTGGTSAEAPPLTSASSPRYPNASPPTVNATSVEDGCASLPHHLVGGRGAQVGDAAAPGDHGVGLDVAPRLQHERPLPRTRVRQHEPFVGERLTVDVDEVEVERAVALSRVAGVAVLERWSRSTTACGSSSVSTTPPLRWRGVFGIDALKVIAGVS